MVVHRLEDEPGSEERVRAVRHDKLLRHCAYGKQCATWDGATDGCRQWAGRRTLRCQRTDGRSGPQASSETKAGRQLGDEAAGAVG